MNLVQISWGQTPDFVGAHDAATVHLGAPWRMPTDAEFSERIRRWVVDGEDVLWYNAPVS